MADTRITLAFVLFCVTGASRTAAADARAGDVKRECVDASYQGQRLRKDGKLLEARAKLLVCGRAQCPTVIAQDCTRWFDEVEKAIPTVVVVASDRSGRETADVRVVVDGATLSETVDGKALFVDPGVHVFRFEMAGEKPVEDKLVVNEGERNRIVRVTFQPPHEAEVVGVTPAPTPPAADATPAGARPQYLAYGLLGLGAAALTGSVVVGLIGRSDVNRLRGSCAPTCAAGDVASAHTELVVADVLLGVAFASAGAGAALLVAHLVSPKPGRATVAVAPIRGGAFGGVQIPF